MAAAGSAVGLGNIWKFPYETGANGGGAFLLLYLLFIVIFGASLILAEMVLGRASGRKPTCPPNQTSIHLPVGCSARRCSK